MPTGSTPSSAPPNPGDPGRELLRIARAAVIDALGDPPATPPDLSHPPAALAQPRAVFVTLRTRAGRLRGCIGTLHPKTRSVAEETWYMAREAALADTRFPRVRRSEIPDLVFEISVLHPLEEVTHLADLDPSRYGVVVSTPDGRRGTLLPDVEGIDTVDRQLEVARRKGGISSREQVRIERFVVDKHVENDPPASRAPTRALPDRPSNVTLS